MAQQVKEVALNRRTVVCAVIFFFFMVLAGIAGCGGEKENPKASWQAEGQFSSLGLMTSTAPDLRLISALSCLNTLLIPMVDPMQRL